MESIIAYLAHKCSLVLQKMVSVLFLIFSKALIGELVQDGPTIY